MRVLLVCDAATVNLQDALLSAEAHGLTPDQITLATNSAALEAASLGSGYDLVLSVASTPGHHSVQHLGTLAAALKPGGSLVVKKEVQASTQQEEQLRKNLLLAGFVDAAAQPDGQGMALRARKPDWETGAKAAISLKPRGGAAAQQRQQNGGAAASLAALSNGKGAWVVSPDEDDGVEVLDEDALLTEEDMLHPAPAANGADDCEVGAAGRKACKNCTCGRAEAGPDAKPAKLTQEMLENPTSGCGSCALGDAFRCAGCPYRGLPAFEMGKPIQLPADFLAVDL